MPRFGSIKEYFSRLFEQTPTESESTLADESWETWNRAPKVVRARLLAAARMYAHKLTPHEVSVLREEITVRGSYEWAIVEGRHFTWGMGVRNYFRDHGVRDSDLPTGNLDDYYIAAIELAVAGDLVKGMGYGDKD